MDRFVTIGRVAFAAMALTLVVAACGDDRSPTKPVEQNPPETAADADNPWTSIFAAADALGGPAQVTFAGTNDRSFRVRKLDPGLAVPQDELESIKAVCAVDDPADRGALDAFRQCMAKALQEDMCRSRGAFVLYRPTATATAWRAYCPSSRTEEASPTRRDKDAPGRVKNIAGLPSPLGRPASKLG